MASRVLHKALVAAAAVRAQEPPYGFRARLQEAADVMCTEDCWMQGVSEISEMMRKGTEYTTIDMRALLYVVDIVLRRTELARQRNLQDPVAEKLAKALQPHLGSWLLQVLRHRRQPHALQKSRRMVQKWRDGGWLNVDTLAPLLDLLNEELPADSQQDDSQQSSLSQPSLPAASGPSPKRPRSEAPTLAPAAPAAPLAPAAPAALAAPGPAPVALAHTRRVVLPGRRSSAPRPAPEPAVAPVAPEAAPKAVTEAKAPKEAPAQTCNDREPHKIWKVLGDCRCLFRAVARARYLDHHNRLPRDILGEPLDEAQRTKERETADKLRRCLCQRLQKCKEEVSALLEGPVPFEEYLSKMEDWRTWGDEICLKFLPDLIGCPIQVYSWNSEQGLTFDAGMYLPTDKVKLKEDCIVLWYNGKTHYDLVSTEWLQWRENTILSSAT
ncbi:unnamed protein product [Effrenium voratum]|uniref:OTU domain-containing protein n=1 Tax=Effrenium voratum TaxID=2562239 RepID=A0AA36IHP3_9DINO|nr:unnamed protein product [Effrenium voratum]